MNPRQFLDLARELAAKKDGPPLSQASHRSAVSRAYYAAYNTTVAYLKKIGVEIADQTRSHEAVRRAFSECSDPTAEVIGEILGDLRAQRRSADYVMDDGESQATAQASCDQAEEVFDQLSRLRNPMAAASAQ